MGGAASAAAPERQQEVEPPAPVKRGCGRPRKVVDPAQIEQQVKRAKRAYTKRVAVDKRQRETYDTLDDVPLHIKRAKANAVVGDPVVIE